MRYKYRDSHPWLTFAANLNAATPAFWAKLGECQSKCEHISGVPLRPDVAQILHRVYLAKGVWGTTAIEGNTLSEEEVLRRIEGKLDISPSQEYLQQEIDNIIAESNAILTTIKSGEVPRLSPERIKQINKSVLNGLKLEDGVVPGDIRNYSVGVMRYRGAPADECEYLLTRLCDWINGPEFDPPPGFNPVHMAILKSVITHLYLEWIHPFGDGNGRTGRMLEVQILLSAGVPSPACHLLSNHYNVTRNQYLSELDKASASGGAILPFLIYAIDGFLDGLKGQLAYIRKLQMQVAWINYVHDYFRNNDSQSAHRQKLILLDILDHEEAVLPADIPTLSPKLAIAYSNKHPKTLLRDINFLVDRKLLIRVGKGVSANEALMVQFLPTRANPK